MAASMPVRAVLMDLDGTLLDTVLDLHQAANAMLRDLGRPEVALVRPAPRGGFVECS